MFTSNRIAKIAASTVAAGAFGLAALAGTATASASSFDDEFLTNISAEGITFDSASGAITAGKQVCGYLANGATGVDVGQDILDETDLTSHQAAVFVVEATYAYCPGYTERITA
ncbi:MAG: DUF732 domain-containing protein [Mycobacterium sp.]